MLVKINKQWITGPYMASARGPQEKINNIEKKKKKKSYVPQGLFMLYDAIVTALVLSV
jgi:hypothetical protein